MTNRNTGRAVLAAAIVASGLASSPARADIEIYNRNGFTIYFSFQGGLAGFAVSNIDYGVGNLDTDWAGGGSTGSGASSSPSRC